MTRRRRLAWVFPLVVLLLMVGCKDKSDRGRPTSTVSSARPLIGLTSVYRTGRGRSNAYVRITLDYVNSVIEGGGLPVILPVIRNESALERYIQSLDALVVIGGKDIPTQVGTKVIHSGRGAGHEIIIDPESRLRKILAAERVRVNSSHHQAVGNVGKGLKVVARSADGIIEALEMTGGKFCLLVQWHPERMKDAAHRKAIFGALIDACKKKVIGNW